MIVWYCRILELDFRILFELKNNFQMEVINYSFRRYGLHLVLDT